MVKMHILTLYLATAKDFAATGNALLRRTDVDLVKPSK
jgi:hypothetical protein